MAGAAVLNHPGRRTGRAGAPGQRRVMASLRSEFLRSVTERGFVHQVTDEAALDGLLAQGGPRIAYIGFDCTADSLHVGSLVPIMLLRWFQRTGHKPIVLMGGGTTKVGDPSGKDESRQILTEETIARNMAGIRGVFEKFLTFGDGPTDAVMVNNADWLDRLEYIPFLREYGRHFSVNRMLSFESVKLRLEREQPLSFLEFNYMVLQAYDFRELSRRLGDAELPAAATAGMVIGGECYLGERRPEGPLGEWTGYYAGGVRDEPVMRIRRVYFRNDPIMTGAPPSRPPTEAAFYKCFWRSATIWEELEHAGVPDVVGVWCPPEGNTRLFTVLAIKQRYPGHARNVLHVPANCQGGASAGMCTGSMWVWL